MNILAFDTSASACSIALKRGEQVQILERHAPMQQAKLILPMVQELLHSFSLTLKDLNAIAYGAGPGSFTGIRIASSVAQGLAFADQIPVVAVSSLAGMAQAAFLKHQWRNLFVAVDARMEQVYWANYQINQENKAELVGREHLCKPDQIEFSSQSGYGIGDAWEKYQDTIVAQLGFVPTLIDKTQLPTAEAILQLAEVKLGQDGGVKSSLALPTYLR